VSSRPRPIARCQSASYCNVECQRTDWPSHKLDCKVGWLNLPRLHCKPTRNDQIVCSVNIIVTNTHTIYPPVCIPPKAAQLECPFEHWLVRWKLEPRVASASVFSAVKLNCDEMLSSFVFNFNVRPFCEELSKVHERYRAAAAGSRAHVGRCRLGFRVYVRYFVWGWLVGRGRRVQRLWLRLEWRGRLF